MVSVLISYLEGLGLHMSCGGTHTGRDNRIRSFYLVNTTFLQPNGCKPVLLRVHPAMQQSDDALLLLIRKTQG